MKCIKSLYKSTYKKNAFTKGKKYFIHHEDNYVWIIDSMGREFSFTRYRPTEINSAEDFLKNVTHLLSEYFDEKTI